jgi:hypothetical protein
MNKFHSFSSARKTRFSIRRVSKTVGNVCQVLLLRDFFCVEIKPFAWEKRSGEPSKVRAPRSFSLSLFNSLPANYAFIYSNERQIARESGKIMSEILREMHARRAHTSRSCINI